jgi:anti-sigma regulatory factor (Ser/Thr protein kinase)
MGSLLVLHETTSAALVRHQLQEDLTGHGVAEAAQDEVVLVASELVGNAIRHTAVAASGRLEIQWDFDPTGVVVSVSDASPEYPQRRRAAPDALTGRGLTIIEALSDDWGVVPTRTGKRVWAHIPTRGASQPDTLRPVAG